MENNFENVDGIGITMSRLIVTHRLNCEGEKYSLLSPTITSFAEALQYFCEFLKKQNLIGVSSRDLVFELTSTRYKMARNKENSDPE